MIRRQGFVIAVFAVMLFTAAAEAQQIPGLSLNIQQNNKPADVVATLQIVGLMTLMALAPALVLMMTSFTRLIVVLHFLRQAMGANQVPPSQLVVGLALILTYYVMSPTLATINDAALKPYMMNVLLAYRRTLFPFAGPGYQVFFIPQA